ncbi:MAG: sulfotransferase [Pseudomonadota bacterium]
MSADNEAILTQAQDLHRAGELENAAAKYAELLEINSDDADACYGLGTVHLQQGNYVDADPLLARAAQLGPNVPEFVFNHACMLQLTQKPAAAATAFMKAAQLAAYDATMTVEICQRLGLMGHHFATVNILAQAAARHTGVRDVWMSYATALSRIRDYKLAKLAYDKAFALAPANDAERFAFAEMLFMGKQPQAATEALEPLTADVDPKVLYLRARCARFSGDDEAAHDYLRQAIAIQPTYGDAWQMLVDGAEDNERETIASTCIEHAASMDVATQDYVSLLFAAGSALNHIGRYSEAFGLFDRANAAQQDLASARGGTYGTATAEMFVTSMRENFATPAAREPGGAPAPIFVVGLPRSGTTLIERILAGLDGVVAGGESEALEQVASHYYWAISQGHAPPIMQLDDAGVRALAGQYWRLQTEAADANHRIVDKMPTNYRHIGMIAHLFPNAHVIYMHRDPRDVALSIYSRRFPAGHAYATDLANIAHCYKMSLELMAHWQTVAAGQILHVEYETLIANPESETQRLAEFCELAWRAECLDFHQRRDASYTFSEMQVREPLSDRGIGRWRHVADQMQPFIDACAKLDLQLAQ